MVRASLALIAVFVSLGAITAAEAAEDAQAKRPLLQPTRCFRTGGENNTLDVIRVTREGLLLAHGRQMKPIQRRLSDKQVRELAKLLSDWDQISTDYLAPVGTRGDRLYTIRCGLKTVRISSTNRDTPKKLKHVVRKLEDLASISD